ncbi:hypothetical protein [Janibacter sp. LM]|uniref:hypothetical protein n=1 Tax=Janibacter sp. LM TaxID=3144845 RepID=UPI0031F64FA8
MSAERLRQAATVLRERAEAATPGPWKADRRGGVTGRFEGMTEVISESTDQVHADYIATMHPGVALVVAESLDNTAAWLDEGLGTSGLNTNYGDAWDDTVLSATRLADQILGDQA